MPLERKNQRTLSPAEWTAFIAAINSMHGIGTTPPAYRDFVRVHVDAMSPVGMSWGVHTMPGMGMVGRNFLAWHRRFLWQLEQRLQMSDNTVTIPYWDWIADRSIAAELDDPALVQSWGITRNWDASLLPSEAGLATVTARTSFRSFQRTLEQVHNLVHEAVGGTMDTSSSPADPLFWLHHANIDRIWAVWQANHAAAVPSNLQEVLQPPPLFGVTVESVLDIAALGYAYA
jgi:tyrosinase